MQQPELEPRQVASPPSSTLPRARREAGSPSWSAGAPPSEHAPGCSRSVDAVARFVEDLGSSTSRLFEVYSDRTRMSLRQGFQRAAIGAAFGACIGIWLGASTLAVFRGACDGLAELWGGQAWSGDLAGGALGLAAAAIAFVVVLRTSSWRELRRLKDKYRRLRSTNGQPLR
jgi:hypothetical protein